MFFLIPPLATLLEVAITATVGTLATLAARDLYEALVCLGPGTGHSWGVRASGNP